MLCISWSMGTFYDDLGVTPAAPDEVIRAAYKAIMRTHHPDVGGDPEVAGRANTAYDVLGDPDRRAAYDRELRDAEPEPKPEPAPAPTRPQEKAPAVPEPARQAVDMYVPRSTWSHLPYLAPAIVFLAAGLLTGVAEHGQPYAALTTAAGIAALIAVGCGNTAWTICTLVASAVSAYLAGGWCFATGALLLPAAAGVWIFRQRILNDKARAELSFFELSETEPGCSGWFLRQVEWGPQSTTARMTPWDHDGNDVSAALWGRYAAGTYIVCDPTIAPAPVHATISDDRLSRAIRAHKRDGKLAGRIL